MARDLLAEGLCDALVSGDRPASLIEAALALAGHDLAGLPRAWSLVSARPAEILRLHDRGRIEPGLRADLAVVNPETRLVEATIAGGRLAYLSGEAGRRFLSSGRGARIAAE
jgi:alpha-D-ribose 1-methylphosphonate 5-triphosphate diphosphatase